MSDEEPGWGSDDGGWPDVPEDGEDVELVNTFDEAEDIKKNQPKEALERFENVIMMEESKDEKKFTFKSLENIVVLSARLGDLDNMIAKQKSLLNQLGKQGKNDQTEAINNVLNAVSTYLQGRPDIQSQMYDLTLGVLKGNDGRLWFNICSRLAKILLESAQYERMDSILTEMKDFCRSASDPTKYDQMKENLLLDAFALEIQMCTETKNTQRMKSVYPQTTKLNSVILDPRVMGVIKECGGKMYMGEKKWENALEELFDSFKNYQEIGSFRAKTVLKYVILASILSGSSSMLPKELINVRQTIWRPEKRRSTAKIPRSFRLIC